MKTEVLAGAFHTCSSTEWHFIAFTVVERVAAISSNIFSGVSCKGQSC